MTEASLKARSTRRLPAVDIAAVAPFAALLALLVLGAAVNPSFLSVENLTNVLTRSAFIARCDGGLRGEPHDPVHERGVG